jgi:hypothetical protein
MNDRMNLSKEEADALGLVAGSESNGIDDDDQRPSGTGGGMFGRGGGGAALPGLGGRPFADLGDFSKRQDNQKNYSNSRGQGRDGSDSRRYNR